MKIVAYLILFMTVMGLSACGGSVDDSVTPAVLSDFKVELETPVVWKQSIDTIDNIHLKLAPYIYKNRLFLCTGDGWVLAFNAKNGRQLWKINTKLPLSSSVGGDDKNIVIGSREGDAIMLSQKDGKQIWKANVSSEILARPLLAGNVAVFRTMDGRLFGVQANNGQSLWVYERKVPALSLHGTSAPVGDGDTVFAGFDNGKLVAFSTVDGKVRWEKTLAVPRGRSELERMVDIDADPLLKDKVVYAVSFQGRIAAIDVSDGNNLWIREMSSYEGMALDDHNVYVTAFDGTVWALDRNSGATFWKQDKLLARNVTAPAVQGQSVVVGDYDGYLHWLARDDGRIIARAKVDSSAIRIAPMVSEDILYVRSRGGVLAAYSYKNIHSASSQ